ncbi:4-hydroxy-3-methylbut-2-en-1-yl diphosphate synthase [candidate division WOR-1 bacterium RIFOXYC2_FULL_37_10]|uniref:4-hydroxy-3-methylbut-2-en-1-yl diphosphate synthase (flavodoxin) n=1 Tax=candidate division WOR-1 bacterium RIFOXYB2_FULL_37_13 TaxID=1802579 RepID=A0A1F4SRP9_UNCSA|nr:MAG: 4-hydroxy-3-methylbut-2-en-1-yl diphosphate synthase [candidate division WOR-1 bacterium RIFOXYA2_FULL_37_7]OGC23131.1 MAG: 4-hydroxy-3-methylbut-2-en-1-yl diphosphate synthase [candidate division WOR-1 bacterium RIFOXYB2_FULL_37_13]OGC37294.1 MAG: 4-hydroxy-3-methylbut-2-en-1-yl diphosphate synthase [candidate division WOR-1 bacterium RIFOXYC2_FULL_37_10]
MISRKKTKTINIGTVAIGGNNPIAVQSMTKTFTSNVAETVKQIKRLEEAGCQIVRCAVPDTESAYAIDKIKKKIRLPLVADIHFDYKLAIIAAEMGADKLRINPGNIGSLEKIKAVVSAAKERGIPIRVGVNSGSLEKKYKHPTAKALVESALSNVRILEKLGFYNIIVAVKSTSVPVTIEAYRLLSQKVDYPLHIGVTESGIPKIGTIKSSVGIGALLAEGIGNTLRVSLTGDPVEEVRVGYEILKALELVKKGVTIISCPTCGRCKTQMEKVVSEIERKTRDIIKPLKIAIMGCEVNGPGEAKDADVGLAGGNGSGLIFVKGKIVKKVPESRMTSALLEEIRRLI